MTPKTIELRVLTREGLVLDDQATSIIAPGELGYLGILHNHAALVTTLVPGKLTWRQLSGGTRVMRIGSGLLEIAQNRLTILTTALTEPAASA